MNWEIFAAIVGVIVTAFVPLIVYLVRIEQRGHANTRRIEVLEQDKHETRKVLEDKIDALTATVSELNGTVQHLLGQLEGRMGR